MYVHETQAAARNAMILVPYRHHETIMGAA